MSDPVPETTATQPDPRGTSVHAIDPRLLEILVCPLSRTPLYYDVAAQLLISRKARLAYPIRDGIPILLVDEARELAEHEYL